VCVCISLKHTHTHTLSLSLSLSLSLLFGLSRGQIQLPKVDSQLSLKVRNIVVGLRTVHPRYLLVHVLRDDSPRRAEFIHLLVRALACVAPHCLIIFIEGKSCLLDIQNAVQCDDRVEHTASYYEFLNAVAAEANR
jgi:hypothetical protein